MNKYFIFAFFCYLFVFFSYCLKIIEKIYFLKFFNLNILKIIFKNLKCFGKFNIYDIIKDIIKNNILKPRNQ